MPPAITDAARALPAITVGRPFRLTRYINTAGNGRPVNGRQGPRTGVLDPTLILHCTAWDCTTTQAVQPSLCRRGTKIQRGEGVGLDLAQDCPFYAPSASTGYFFLTTEGRCVPTSQVHGRGDLPSYMAMKASTGGGIQPVMPRQHQLGKKPAPRPAQGFRLEVASNLLLPSRHPEPALLDRGFSACHPKT